MKKIFCLLSCFLSLTLAHANNLPVDSKAPDFKLTDVHGDEALQGKPVTVKKSKPYGCSVKY